MQELATELDYNITYSTQGAKLHFARNKNKTLHSIQNPANPVLDCSAQATQTVQCQHTIPERQKYIEAAQKVFQVLSHSTQMTGTEYHTHAMNSSITVDMSYIPKNTPRRYSHKHWGMSPSPVPYCSSKTKFDTSIDRQPLRRKASISAGASRV